MQTRTSELQKITITPYNESEDLCEHEDANPESGLFLKSKIEFSSLLNAFIKKFGTNILSGNFNVTTIIPSSKAQFEGSYLEMNALSNTIIPKFLKAASETNCNIEKLKLISTGLLASQYLPDSETCGMVPIPVFKDEFLEGTLSDGTYFRTDFHTRNPPKNKIKVIGPEECYIYQSTVQTSAKIVNLNPNNIIGNRLGRTILKLKDGNEYKIKFPSFAIDSCLSKTKTIRYTNSVPSYVLDKTNNLIAKFKFKEKKFGFFGGGYPTPILERNGVEITIKKIGADEPVLSSGSGNLLCWIQFENQCYWRIDDKQERYDYYKEGQNEGENAYIKKEYMRALNEKRYEDCDDLLEIEDKKSPTSKEDTELDSGDDSDQKNQENLKGQQKQED